MLTGSLLSMEQPGTNKDWDFEIWTTGLEYPGHMASHATQHRHWHIWRSICYILGYLKSILTDSCQLQRLLFNIQMHYKCSIFFLFGIFVASYHVKFNRAAITFHLILFQFLPQKIPLLRKPWLDNLFENLILSLWV